MSGLPVDILAASAALSAWEAIGRLALASALGSLIGIEREYHGRSAGFRTQLLVALGAALAMLVSLHFAEIFGPVAGETIRVDPARVAYGVMGGIGFIGAGAIIQQGAGVRGLTTAASLWCTAAVGLAAGFGMYALSTFTTGLVLFALLVLGRVESIMPARTTKMVTLIMPADETDNASAVRQLLAGQGIQVKDVGYARDGRAGVETITLRVSVPLRMGASELADIIRQLPQVRHITIS